MNKKWSRPDWMNSVGFFAMSVPGGIVLVLVETILVLGCHYIAAHNMLLWMYLVVAVVVGYVAPFVVWFLVEGGLGSRFVWAFMTMAVISPFLLFAPSSFIADAGCRMDKEESIIAMRAMAPLGILHVLTPGLKDDHRPFNCDTWL